MRSSLALVALLVAVASADGAPADEAFAAVGATRPVAAQTAPEFRLPSLTGGEIGLADFKGQLVLVNFWASWCAPCREEMPGLERLARRYRAQGLTVLAVNEDGDDGRRAARFVARQSLGLPVVLDRDGAVATRYRATGLPVTFLIAPDGRLLATITGARDWDGPAAAALIESLLGASH